jgi:hypothetical protein
MAYLRIKTVCDAGRRETISELNAHIVNTVDRRLTMLPARPPAMRANPMNSKRRAFHATPS